MCNRSVNKKNPIKTFMQHEWEWSVKNLMWLFCLYGCTELSLSASMLVNQLVLPIDICYFFATDFKVKFKLLVQQLSLVKFTAISSNYLCHSSIFSGLLSLVPNVMHTLATSKSISLGWIQKYSSHRYVLCCWWCRWPNHIILKGRYIHITVWYMSFI